MNKRIFKRSKLTVLAFFIFCIGFNAFSQNWFDMSMPNMDRRACLVSEDAGRTGYRASVDLVNRLSRNRAEDVSVYVAKEVNSDQITQIALQLYLKTGKLGTYLMEADIPVGNINMRYYYIICAGWDATYLYVYAHAI